jgi:hypothetical protein
MSATASAPDDGDATRELSASIRHPEGKEEVVDTTLRTDERVIARVTDGIYRQPASALRELISNAYDADASRVVIRTDRPRFAKITIEDNGHGMSPEALAHVLLHIGGSAKRANIGSDLGVTSKSDRMKSPGGRRLIGKIGIGLFSVSQLTRTFQIITKVASDNFRTIATVVLRQYSDEVSAAAAPDGKYESGKVKIWRERAADAGAQGTTIVLTGVRPQARETLQSRDIWSLIDQEEIVGSGRRKIDPPTYHIGRVDDSDAVLKKSDGGLTSLPWTSNEAPAAAFRKLVNSVWETAAQGTPNPSLERLFDYYLRMVWQLSLAVPLPYVEGHLFDMDLAGWADVYGLSNKPNGGASAIDSSAGGSIRAKFGLVDPVDAANDFEVLFDDLKLLRPVKFSGLPTTSHALKRPIVFIGQYREEFPKVAIELSGGPLEFEAYLFWNPKIAPVEHQGSLVRIHGSSGTLYDRGFMRYPVAEQTRLRQITCEIFVTQGLEGALNIDRESFNNAHPHAVVLAKWLHGALRQLASTQKRLAGGARGQARDMTTGAAVSDIQELAIAAWIERFDDTASVPPAVVFGGSGDGPRQTDSYSFSRDVVFGVRQGRRTAAEQTRITIAEERVRAVAQVLAAYGLLDQLSAREQEQLLRTLHEIMDFSAE